MKVDDYRNHYYELSGKASDTARSLAFAGIAAAWVFRTSDPAPMLPRDMLLPLALLIAALSFDLLQYSVASAQWGYFARRKERANMKSNRDPVITAPRWMNWPANFFFWGKLVLLTFAYGFISWAVSARWVARPPF